MGLTDRPFLEATAAAAAQPGTGAPARAGVFPRAVMVAALAGVGDRRLRAAQDFLLGEQGYGDIAPAAGWQPVAGESVQYALPKDANGLCRVGRIREVQGQHAIVEVADGAYDVVPLDRLAALSDTVRGEAQRRDIQAALQAGVATGQGEGLVQTLLGSGLRATRDIAPMPGYSDAFTWTLSYSAGRKPSVEEVQHYVAHYHPQAHIADGDDSWPGRIALILTFPRQAQTVSPEQAPSVRDHSPGLAGEERPGELVDPMMGQGGMHAYGAPANALDADKWSKAEEAVKDQKDSADDWYALVNHVYQNMGGRFSHEGAPGDSAAPAGGSSDAIGGGGGESTGGSDAGGGTADPTATGVGGYGLVASWLEHLAALNPECDFIAGATTEDVDGSTHLAFHLRKEGRALFVHGLHQGAPAFRPVLAEHAPPAEGLISWVPGRPRPRVLLAGLPAGAAGLRTAAELPYAMGQGPQSVHEDEPGANDSGSYVVQAEEDGEHRETIGGPGLMLAHSPHSPEDGPAAHYYEDYYGQLDDEGREYGEMMTRNLPTRTSRIEDRVASVYEAWADAQRRPPSTDEISRVLNVLATAPGREVLSQLTEGLGATPARGRNFDLVESLLRSRWMDAAGANAVDRFVTNYLARNPERLEQMGLYRDVLKDALANEEPRLTQRLVQKFAPEQALFQPEAPPEPYAQPAGPEPVAQPAGEMDTPDSAFWRSHMPGEGSTVRQPEEAPSGMRGLLQRLRRKPKSKPRRTTAPADSGPSSMGDLPDLPPLQGPTASRARGRPRNAASTRRLPTADELRFRMTQLTRRGDYLAATIVWDPEATTGMAPSSVVTAIREYVKRRSTEKENIDLGNIGRVTLEMCDLEAGMAEVRFRSSETRVGPPEVVTRENGEYHELA